MRKTLVVAKSEFLTAVRSKGFIIGVLLMPILVTVSIVVQRLSEKHVDVTDRYVQVIDGTGELYEVLAAASEERNRVLDAKPPDPPMPKFFPTRHVGPPTLTDEDRVRLSDQIKSGQLFAFVEIPASAMSADARPSDRIVYYSDKPTYEDLRRWIGQTLNKEILKRRLSEAGLTQAQYERLSAEIETEHRGLTARSASGEIQKGKEVDRARTYWVPMTLMFLLWMVVMSAVPQLLNSAIEEKMIRVSEVLLGAVTPFELMMGKLLAITGVSTVLSALYLGGGYVIALNTGTADAVPLSILPYFVIYMLLSVFFFGSVFIAIGAACSELKDAQGLMAPAMLVLMLPIFVWMPVLNNPDSTLAIIASLFPPATPMLMLLRIASHPQPPMWQIILSIVLTSASTLACIWAAGKIFRIGILSQGKTPSFREMIRWVTSS